MEHETSILLDVTVALGVAFAGGWLATRIGLPTIAGYILAGLVISPFTPGFAGDAEGLRVVADVGVVLLLFAIGVQLDLADMQRAGMRTVIAASLQTIVVVGGVAGAAMALGVARDPALYAGAAASISSSAVLVKLLDERGGIATGHGRIAVAWSVVQDLWAVVLIVVLGTLAEGGSSEAAVRDVALAGLKAAAFVGAVIVIGLRVMPAVLARVAEERSRELFFLAIAALAMGTALASEQAGLSLALGAFLAGIVVSESDLSHRVLGELLPTRDVFAVVFFTSAGMLIDPTVLRDEWPAVLGLTAAITVGKTAITGLLIARAVAPIHTAVLASAALVGTGEFSFLLARQGLGDGTLSGAAFSVILAATVASILAAPAIMLLGERLLERSAEAVPMADAEDIDERKTAHAVVCGYDPAGELVARVLSARFDVLVVEPDVRRARTARDAGLRVLEGNPASPAVIEHMDLQHARVVIITLADPLTVRLLAERVRAINPRADVIGRAFARSEATKLAAAGARSVVDEEEAAYELARYGLRRFGVSAQESLAVVQRLRATRA